jgi:F0F1-type ATP synthase membrane subunit c/vacuolar-type H+-ATPase subunit K
MQEQKPNIELIFKNMAMVWLGLFSSQLMFVIVSFAAKPELLKFDLSAPPLGAEPATVIAFAVLGLILIAASFAMKANFQRKAVDQQNAGLVQTGMIVACAMCEAASILGLVLAFSHSYQYFFLWIAAALAGMAFHFPSRTKIMNASLGKRL